MVDEALELAECRLVDLDASRTRSRPCCRRSTSRSTTDDAGPWRDIVAATGSSSRRAGDRRGPRHEQGLRACTGSSRSAGRATPARGSRRSCTTRCGGSRGSDSSASSRARTPAARSASLRIVDHRSTAGAPTGQTIAALRPGRRGARGGRRGRVGRAGVTASGIASTRVVASPPSSDGDVNDALRAALPLDASGTDDVLLARASERFCDGLAATARGHERAWHGRCRRTRSD